MKIQSDTRKLLITGLSITGTGAVAVLLLFTVFGGIVNRQGPHTNMGWFVLLIALGCLPTGCMSLALGLLKLLGDLTRR